MDYQTLRFERDAVNAGLNAGSLADALRLEDHNQVLLMENPYIADSVISEVPPPSQKRDVEGGASFSTPEAEISFPRGW